MEENNNSEKKSDSFKQFSQFIKTPKGKAVAFFGGYLIFFIILSVVARVGGSGDTIGSTIDFDAFSMKSINGNNYNFTYQYVIDDVTTSYEGMRNGDKALFSDGVNQFYQDNQLFMRQQNGVWIKYDNPYILPVLLDSTVVSNLVDSATYISKTELATGEEILNYQITTTTLVKLLDEEDVDLDDPVNTIQLTTDKQGEVNKIEYDVSSYAKYKKLATKQFRLTLTYSNFGEIDEIEVPK